MKTSLPNRLRLARPAIQAVGVTRHIVVRLAPRGMAGIPGTDSCLASFGRASMPCSLMRDHLLAHAGHPRVLSGRASGLLTAPQTVPERESSHKGPDARFPWTNVECVRS